LKKIKLYSEKEGRDSGIYFGIDGSKIPKEKVRYSVLDSKGFYSFEGDDVRYAETLLVFSKNFFYILTNNPDQYVTEEDLQTPLKFHKTSLGECIVY
jgi:hypothetical protein